MFDLEFCRHVFYVEFFFWRSQQLNFAYYSLITQQLNFAYSPTTEVKGSSLFPKGSKMVSKISLSEAALRFKVAPRLHTQKRHRPVTACCTFRPDTGMILSLYQAVDAYRLFKTDGIRLEQSVGLSVLYQSDVTEWYRYVGNRLLQSVRTGCKHDGPTALMEAVGIR